MFSGLNHFYCTDKMYGVDFFYFMRSEKLAKFKTKAIIKTVSFCEAFQITAEKDSRDIIFRLKQMTLRGQFKTLHIFLNRLILL